ncbi:MAG: Flp pilus assembly protein CpaB [Verrucomicrobiae bacterium]|nr:Flp pilus assembly protein CpaB [Verrucomicrobiae bacterium]
MNKKSTVLILGTAIVLALITAFAIYRYLDKYRNDSERNRRDVVVAATFIKSRTVIQPQMLALKRMNKDSVAQGAATSIDEVVGKVSPDAYKQDDQIRLADLVMKDKLPGLSIPDGKRAVTIRVDDVKGVGGSVHPGAHVDILATYRDPITGQQLTQIILQRMEVLAIDEAQTDTAKNGKGASKSVTLAVTPEEATKVAVTDSEGALRMMLRPEDAKDVADLPAVSLRSLVKPSAVPDDSQIVKPSTPQVLVGEKEPPKVRVYIGNQPVKDVTVGE